MTCKQSHIQVVKIRVLQPIVEVGGINPYNGKYPKIPSFLNLYPEMVFISPDVFEVQINIQKKVGVYYIFPTVAKPFDKFTRITSANPFFTTYRNFFPVSNVARESLGLKSSSRIKMRSLVCLFPSTDVEVILIYGLAKDFGV
jgi:hypothetical protein